MSTHKASVRPPYLIYSLFAVIFLLSAMLASGIALYLFAPDSEPARFMLEVVNRPIGPLGL